MKRGSSTRVARYIKGVTRGEGYMPWQPRDRAGQSDAEMEFRAWAERRKDRLLAARVDVRHPSTVTDEQIDQAKRNIARAEWAAKWYENLRAQADHIVAQDGGYIDRMISALTPTNPYGFTCPRCVGVKSQEGVGYSSCTWDYRTPDVLHCKVCGQTLPDAAFPETGVLTCPRAGQTFSYFLNDRERRHPRDRSGKLAWQWVWKPTQVSFEGIVREKKILFMINASRTLGLMHRFTGRPEYAIATVRILERLAHCCGQWLYHDCYGSFADCDPLYAAWHDMALPLLWKRNATVMAFRDSQYETGPVHDSLDCAKMLATYFCAGRVHPSADCYILNSICPAYDMVHDATDATGRPLWSSESRRRVERDLILEYLLGGEPFVGGPGKATSLNNKAPYVYAPMATAAVALGMPHYAHVALMGYEALRDKSFYSDGFSGESPSYTEMFLSGLISIPERLHGFRWPQWFRPRRGVVDIYGADSKLALMMRNLHELTRSNGRHVPLSDTPAWAAPGPNLFEIGVKRYPRVFSGLLPKAYEAYANPQDEWPIPTPNTAGRTRQVGGPGEYAAFNLSPGELTRRHVYDPPEVLVPQWQTAILRHGRGDRGTALAMPFSPPGIHRHRDLLTLYYWSQGRTILGEQGYVCDTPQIDWAHTTKCHNLVVVDDEEQVFWKKWADQSDDPQTRRGSLRLMASCPELSVVEAQAHGNPQCTEYRRLIALVKGPDDQTFAVDIFRVAGGRKHAYRLFSEVAASGAPGGKRRFVGLDMPKEPPLPNYGKSLKPEHVFGLRDAVAARPRSDHWQAIWEHRGLSYRLWMLSHADRVEASHGPGQETYTQTGRRVRYLDVIQEGRGVRSTFVALHEPSGVGGVMPITSVRRLPVPAASGPHAVALRIESRWGAYLVLNEFDRECEVEGVRFQGKFGVWCNRGRGGWYMACGATMLGNGRQGFEQAPAAWAGRVTGQTDSRLTVSAPRPKGWVDTPAGCRAYVLVGRPGRMTGYEVASMSGRSLEVARFPLREASRFELPALRFAEV